MNNFSNISSYQVIQQKHADNGQIKIRGKDRNMPLLSNDFNMDIPEENFNQNTLPDIPQNRSVRKFYEHEQLDILQNEYRSNKYLQKSQKKELSQKLKVPEDVENLWFQKRRSEEREAVKRYLPYSLHNGSRPVHSLYPELYNVAHPAFPPAINLHKLFQEKLEKDIFQEKKVREEAEAAIEAEISRQLILLEAERNDQAIMKKMSIDLSKALSNFLINPGPKNQQYDANKKTTSTNVSSSSFSPSKVLNPVRKPAESAMPKSHDLSELSKALQKLQAEWGSSKSKDNQEEETIKNVIGSNLYSSPVPPQHFNNFQEPQTNLQPLYNNNYPPVPMPPHLLPNKNVTTRVHNSYAHPDVMFPIPNPYYFNSTMDVYNRQPFRPPDIHRPVPTWPPKM